MSKIAPKRRTQAERREEAESRLVLAAIKLMSERGYDGFTLAELGVAAGYSRGLPAHYFGKKEDLLAMVAEAITGSYDKSIAQLPSSEEGLPRLAAMIRHYVRNGDARGRRALNMLLTEAMVRPGLKRTIAKLNEQGLERLRVQLRAGVAAGQIPDDIDIEVEARVIYSFLRGQMSFVSVDPKFDGQVVGESFIAMMEARLTAGATGKATASAAQKARVSAPTSKSVPVSRAKGAAIPEAKPRSAPTPKPKPKPKPNSKPTIAEPK